MKRPAGTQVLRARQLGAIVSPVRQELLDVLARLGPVSVAELGATLGRPADGLYYHVRALQRLGLVRSAGTRRSGRREEALFRASASQFAIRYPATAAGRSRAVVPIVSAMLRLGTRDFRRALADERTRFEGPAREVWALRTTGWLTEAQLRRVNGRVRDLAAATTRRDPAGRLYAVTVLLTPLVHRENRTGRRARRRT